MPKVSTTSSTTIRELKDLTRVIQRAAGFPEVLAALKNGHGATIDGAWGSAGPLAAAALGLHAPTTLVIVLAHVGDVDDFRDDVATFAGVAPEVFPAWDQLPREAGADRRGLRPTAPGRQAAGRRAAAPVRRRAVPGAVAAGADPRRPRADARARVRVGDTVAVEELTAWLAERGMSRVEVVEVPGEFSLRGGILDVFPPDVVRAGPHRVLRRRGRVDPPVRPRDPALARPLGLGHADRRPRASTATPRDLGHVADVFPEGTWVALVEPNDLREEGRQYLARVDDPRGLFTVESTFARLIRHPSVTLSTLAAGSLETTCHLRVESVERFSGELTKVKAELDSAAGRRPRPDRLPQRGRGRAARRGLRRHRDRARRAGCT